MCRGARAAGPRTARLVASVALAPVPAPFLEASSHDRRARPPEERHVEGEVVKARQTRPQSLTRDDEMPEVRTRVAPASRTSTILIDRARIGAKACVAQVQRTARREDHAVRPY